MKSDIFVCDLDDTFIQTVDIFAARMSELYTGLSERYLSAVSKEEITRVFEAINNAGYGIFGVHTSRWEWVYEVFEWCFPGLDEDGIAYMREKIAEIYTTIPKLHEDAEQFLKCTLSQGIPLYLVTHAMPGWTWWKLSVTGLDAYFNNENVFVVEALRHKDADAWRTAIRSFGYDPRDVVVIGDSLRSDIAPALEIGARAIHVVRERSWSIQHTEIEGDFIRVHSLSEIPSLFTEENFEGVKLTS